jgi:hypothetical protein
MWILKEITVLLYFVIKVMFIKQFAKKRIGFYIKSQKIK